jgi:cold shock CspA family protein
MSIKIPESEWGAVVERRERGESVASIARAYACSPALVYSVLSRSKTVPATAVSQTAVSQSCTAAAQPEELAGRSEPDTLQQEALSPSAEDEAAGELTQDADPDAYAATDDVAEVSATSSDDSSSVAEHAEKPPALTARLDENLRAHAEAAISQFLSALAAARNANGDDAASQDGLRKAASALMRAGARTIIVLERLRSAEASDEAEKVMHPRERGRRAGPSTRARPELATGIAATPSGGEGEVEGTVKWFKPAKGFGFVALDTGGDVFVHMQALAQSGLSDLQSGQRVRLTARFGPKGPQADRIALM